MRATQSRRRFVESLAVAGIGLLGSGRAWSADPPPETTTIRLRKTAAICFAPLYVVDAFLRMEGFTQIRFLPAAGGFATSQAVAGGHLDFGVTFAGRVIHELDTGLPITALGGLHVGCYELFAHEPIRSVRDLKGTRVAIMGKRANLTASNHLYLAIMATLVGLDPKRDIEWVPSLDGTGMELFVAGQADAFLGFPPEPQALRARGHSRVILNTLMDQPWSRFFCCMVYGNRTWVRDHPVATKRFLRAVYKAAEFCTARPASAARQVVEGGFAKDYGYALKTIEEIPYDLWHEYDAEDTMRFFALRLHEARMIQHTPNSLITQGADWRFLNELKREMKV